jgi:hypothetical protein
MEHEERADQLEREADRVEEVKDRLGEDIEESRSDWEGKKSSESAPGAADPESTGPHHIDEEDPASGEPKGEERDAEREETIEADEREDAT